MNKIILMGRLTKDPDVRYSQSDNPIVIVRYTLAVNRKYKREGEPDADFINCVAFAKQGEFAEKYFKKGLMVCVVGRLQIRTYDDQQGQRRWITEVLIEEQNFAENKSSSSANNNTSDATTNNQANNDSDINALLGELNANDIPF
jgi:single-strand DNA-binding protein